MAKQTKSLKKYAKKHLSETIEKRKRLRPVISKIKARQERKKESTVKSQEKASQDHMKELQAIEADDKEFLEYLQTEEPELLNFGKLDQLSDEEDEQHEDQNYKKTEGEQVSITEVEIDSALKDAFGAKLSFSSEKWLKHLVEKNIPTVSQLRKVMCVQEKVIERIIEDELLSESTIFTRANTLMIKYVPLAIKGIHEQANGIVSCPKDEGKVSYESFTRMNKEFVKIPFQSTLESLAKKFLQNITKYVRYILNIGQKVNENLYDNDLLPVLFGRMPIFGGLQQNYTKAFKTIAKLAIRCVCSTGKGHETRLGAMGYLLQTLSKKRGGSFSADRIFKQLFVTLIDSVQAHRADFIKVSSMIVSDIVALFGEDLRMAYQTLFVYLKKLSSFVRAALLRSCDFKMKASIVNWQFVIALRAISCTVLKYQKGGELDSLIYPLTQICLGTLEVVNSAAFIPFQYQILDILVEISGSTNLHVTLTPYLLRVLKYKIFQVKPISDHANKAQSDFGDCLPLLLQVEKKDMKLSHVQYALVSKLVRLISLYTSKFAYSISFPELFAILHHDLKKSSKSLPCAGHSMVISKYLRSVSLTEDLVRERRKSVTFGPSDPSKIEIWEAAFRDEVTSLPILDFLH